MAVDDTWNPYRTWEGMDEVEMVQSRDGSIFPYKGGKHYASSQQHRQKDTTSQTRGLLADKEGNQNTSTQDSIHTHEGG